jgi:DUF1680 family protein
MIGAIVTSVALLLAATVPDPIRPVPLRGVVVEDAFWTPRLETNRTVSVPFIFRQNEQTGRVANLERAAGRRAGRYEGRRFNDTDVYKAIEAAAYTLVHHPDPALQARVEALVELIAAAQQQDGYLFPARTIDPANPAPGVGPRRYAHLNGSHELYNFGHLYEAAVAHQLATGRASLMGVARKNADLVAREFGPGARRAVPGHEEIELALVRLFRATRERKYLELARHFLDERGRPHETEDYPPGPFAMYNDRAYRQDHAPLVEQRRAVGHAVRAMYAYAAMADVAALQGDAGYAGAIAGLWQDVAAKRLYLTGGVGARDTVEAFGDDYELPNREAYTESCASVGMVLWNHRMFLLEGDGRYVDLLERTLLNGALAGVSLSGDRFFYQNPLESAGDVERSPYFEVACCPANLARLLAQLPGLVYAQRETALYVNLFVGSRARVALGGSPVEVHLTTGYPWEGSVTLRLRPERPAAFAVHLRVPGWARGEPLASDLYRYADAVSEPATLRVNGAPTPIELAAGYARLERVWAPGDSIELTLPMPVRRVLAHPGVTEDAGKAAVERGPLVYAFEAADHGGSVRDLALPLDAPLAVERRGDLLGGATALTGQARTGPDASRTVPVLAVPYYAWANRGKGEMAVWLPVAPRAR